MTSCRLTPTIATLSMEFLKPIGWSLAYFAVMVFRKKILTVEQIVFGRDEDQSQYIIVVAKVIIDFGWVGFGIKNGFRGGSGDLRWVDKHFALTSVRIQTV
jgi:hypothetical protein